MRTITALLAGILLAPLALSQDADIDPDAAAEEPLRRYTVEVIIFSHTDAASVGTEIFPPDPLPSPDGALLDEDGNPILPGNMQEGIPVYGDDVPVAEEAVAEEALQNAWAVVPGFPADFASLARPLAADRDGVNPFQLVLLAEDDYSLVDVADRFERLDAYETLLHVGWTQPAFPQEATPPIELRLLAEPPPGLDGTLTLYLSRYLHLVVDLALDAPSDFEEENDEQDASFRFGDARPRFEDAFEPGTPVVRFRIQEDRILKNGELRYFDHPKFGVLARVMRVEEPEDEAATAPLAARP